MRRLAALGLLMLVGGVPGAAFAEEKEGYVRFTEEHPLGVPEPGKALVYVVRPTTVAFAIKSFFGVDDTVAGINRGSSYFFAQVEPGKRTFWSKSENYDVLEVEIEVGKTYYVQQHVRIGAFRARTKLEVLGDDEGKAALAKCKKYGTLTERGQVFTERLKRPSAVLDVR